MNLKSLGTLLIGLMLMDSGGIARAGPFEDGIAASQRGDYATALRLLRPLAEKGWASAQINLGFMCAHGQGVSQDYEESLKWYRLAAAQGNGDAQYNLGFMYQGGLGVARDLREAVKWYRLAAAQGYALAQTNVGLMYKFGRGVSQDYAEATKWFRLAAVQGNAEAQSNLGSMHESGFSVSQDDKEAIKWYRLAAAQGEINAREKLAWMYRINAQKGDAAAQNSLGVIYQGGQGVAQDYQEALKWYRLAAAQGNGDAQYNLGVMYASEQGVPRDYVRSHMWISISQSKGAVDEGKVLQAVAAKMTPNQVETALRLAKRCEESNYKQCEETGGDQTGAATSVPMQRDGGVYVVPVRINDAITLDFVVDSGAADVSIPADVVSTLMRTGTLKESDFLGQQTYRLADGSKVPSRTFRIRSLKLGDKVLENVDGSVAPMQGPLLLGQSFLNRFKSYSVDNIKHALIFE